MRNLGTLSCCGKSRKPRARVVLLLRPCTCFYALDLIYSNNAAAGECHTQRLIPPVHNTCDIYCFDNPYFFTEGIMLWSLCSVIVLIGMFDARRDALRAWLCLGGLVLTLWGAWSRTPALFVPGAAAMTGAASLRPRP